ncbi:MAG: hypothetical protein N2C14_27135 [Planctomycetales bacterium]
MSVDDEFEDHDWKDDEDDDTEVVPCPECGVDIYEDAEQCPACGQYVVVRMPDLWSQRPLWWVVLGLLGVAAVIVVFTLGSLSIR